MDQPSPATPDRAHATPEEIHSALFAQLVSGHAQMALTFLGQLPNPQTGEAEAPNAEAARLFIDQLEMLEVKTKGNLTDEEARLLKQALAATRMAFVEVIDRQLEGGAKAETPVSPAAEPTAPVAPAENTADADSKVKFSKKYG